MIFHLHTPDGSAGSGFCGSDYIPRIGETIRVDYNRAEYRPDPDDSGLYRVLDVLYEVPNNPGRQRIDVYAEKISDLPKTLSFQDWQAALRTDKLRLEGGFPA